MTNKPHGDGRTACVRRLYLHARDGGRVLVPDIAQIVRWMEEKDQEIAELQHFRRLDKLSETGTAQAFAALSDGEKLRWFVTTGQRDREQTERIKELEAENKRLRKALELISTVTEQRPVSGHQKHSCAWCNGSVRIAKQALAAGAEQPASAGDWRCPNCGYIDAQRVTIEEACDACRQPVEWVEWEESRTDVIGQNGNDGHHYERTERESLPLMARREWIDPEASYVCVSPGGRETHAYEDLPDGNMYREWGWDMYRIADTDEHGLPVIERTADMPEGAQYRGWTERTRDWTYYVCFIEKHAHNRFERIEGYNGQGQESAQ